MGRAEDAWEQIWARSRDGSRLQRFARQRGLTLSTLDLSIDRFDLPPSLAPWVPDDSGSMRSFPHLFQQAFAEYLDELRAEDWTIVQVKVTGAIEDEFGDPTADRVEVFSYDESLPLATYRGDDLHSFVQDYEVHGWHDVALNPPKTARW